ncbi:MAG TPA: cytochrome c [Gemmatimonadaceae bacterium]|nr:cytochrome c [Gemmatimonadaceae bacterium]
MRLALIILTASIAACGRASEGRTGSGAAAAVMPGDVRPTPRLPERFEGVGRLATAAEVRAWDIDVNPSGEGLPPGRGTYEAGRALFAAKCASCHGAKGEGMAAYPKLIGREPREGFPFARDLKYVKTIGNYWPYATTLYDYINRAMPLTAPGSLAPDEVYSLVAWLLAENEIIPRDAVMDARTLPEVRMPARDRFVADDRRGGPGFR